MAEIFNTLKRGGKEVAQESAKTDGMCKGGSVGGSGSSGDIIGLGKRGGKEIAQESAKCEGMCK
jgi:hypothetical protein